MSGQPNERVERIDSLPTNAELGIEKIPVVVTSGRQHEPSKVRVVKLPPFDGLEVSEPNETT